MGASFQQGADWAAMECRRHEWVVEQQARDSTAWGKEPPTLAWQQQPEIIRQRWLLWPVLGLLHREQGWQRGPSGPLRQLLRGRPKCLGPEP